MAALRDYLTSEPYEAHVVYPDEIHRIIEAATQQSAQHPDRLIQQLAHSTTTLAARLPDTWWTTSRADTVYLQLSTLTLAMSARQRLHNPHLSTLYLTATAALTTLRHHTDAAIPPTETIVLTHT